MTETFLPIHIGLHKTGTTFLQHSVFPVFFPTAPLDRDGALANEGAEARQIFTEVTEGKGVPTGNPKARTICISSESLSGRQKANYPGECIERFGRFVKSTQGLERRPRVVLLVREHLSWLRSGFMHQYRNGSSKTWKQHLSNFSYEDLSWSRRIEALSANDSLVINYGDLRSDPQAVVERIGQFWGVDTERIEAAKAINLQQTYNAMPSDIALKILRQRMRIHKKVGAMFPEPSRSKFIPSAMSQDRLAQTIDRIWKGQKGGLASALTIEDQALNEFISKDWQRTLKLIETRSKAR